MGKKSSPSEDGKRKTAVKTTNRSRTRNEVKDVGMWNIEGLEKKRVRKGRVEYLVKWRDFPSSENTWEPVEHLTTCPKLIQRFASRNRKKKLGRPRAKRAVVSISETDDTFPGNPLDAPIPQSSTTADDDSEIENADPNPVSAESNTVTLTYEFDWTEHPVKAVIGIDRLKATGELFYKVAWDRLAADIGGGGGGDRIVTEWKLLPAVIVREKVPHLVIEFLGTIASWAESTPGNSPRQSPNNSVSEEPNPSADSERTLSSCDHKSDNEGQGRGDQMEADSMHKIPESQINLELALTVETHKDNEEEEKDELMT